MDESRRATLSNGGVSNEFSWVPQVGVQPGMPIGNPHTPMQYVQPRKGSAMKKLVGVVGVLLVVVAVLFAGLLASSVRGLHEEQRLIALYVANEIILPEDEEVKSIEFTKVHKEFLPDITHLYLAIYTFVVNGQYEIALSVDEKRFTVGSNGESLSCPDVEGLDFNQWFDDYWASGGSRGITDLDGIDVTYVDKVS